jgi:beta-phosphoglucomutase-like phosphatase (HAD superfamily)
MANLELDTVSTEWQLALDATDRALGAAGRALPAAEQAHRRKELVDERRRTADELASLAQMAGVRPAPWLSPVPVRNQMLGLPATVTTCVFDLDGVLTDSGILHAWAWAQVLDDFLLQLSAEAEWQFIPFDREGEYRDYLDGRPRLEGLYAFLESRGIRIPDRTARGLARRKKEMLERGLHERGTTALSGARRYLEAAGRAGLGRALVSASANTAALLRASGLATVVDLRIDAEVMRTEGLRARPAPDVLLAACRRLGAEPEQAVTYTYSVDGVIAGHEAGLAVVGVADGARAERLQHYGAERLVPSLAELLDRRLVAERP